MTSAYKLLINEDDAEFSKFNQTIKISIKNPKNISVYELWSDEISNNKTKKIFTLSAPLLVECINNYNENVLNKPGFTYNPTASVLLNFPSNEPESVYGGLLYINEINFISNTLNIICIEKHNLFIEEVNDFPDDFKGNVRVNINGFQSTSLLGQVDNEFLDWLDPSYNRITPYPYIEKRSEIVENRESPAYNFLAKGIVTITRKSSTVSEILIKDPSNMVFYEIWGPLTNRLNIQETMKGSLEPAIKFYTLFRSTNDKILNTPGADKDKQLFFPTTTFDLKDGNGNLYSLIGTIIDVNTNFESTQNSITYTVDSSNYLVYPFNRIQSLPSGEFEMFMEIDGISVPENTSQQYSLPEITSNYNYESVLNNPTSINELANIFYNFSNGVNFPGQGEKIGIITSGHFWPLFTTLSPSKQNEKLNKLKELFRSIPGLESYNPKISVVSNLTSDDYNNYFPQPYQQSAQDKINNDVAEDMLDLNMVSFLLPHISEIVIYIFNDEDWEENEDTGNFSNESVSFIINHAKENDVNVLTWSYGDPEQPSINFVNNESDDQIFEKIKDSRISLCVSTGDSGGADGLQYASVSKYAIAVGGTQLGPSERPDYGWTGSTGGISSLVKASEVQENFTKNESRQVPDISALSQPLWYVPIGTPSSDTWSNQFGGTSASAPLMASTILCINQARKQVNKLPLTNQQFLSVLYNNYETLQENKSILDIVEGNSRAHNSKPGYDLVTGLGSLNDTSALVNYFVDNVE